MKNKNLDVSVIILYRNGKKITLECLHSLMSEAVDEIIIVDNGSTDGTLEAVKKLMMKDRRIQVIQNTTNNGFAQANNQGFSKATCNYILFLNNDTLLEKNFLTPMLNFLKQNQAVAAVQPLIVFPDQTIDSVGSFLTPTGFLYHKAHRMMPDKRVMRSAQVYSLKGACMLWKKSVLDEIGLFEESYFAYFEETELCHRALNAGYQVFYCPSSRIMHLGGFTSNALPSDLIQFHNYKNRVLTYFKHLPLLTLFQIVLVHTFFCEAIVLKTLLSSPKLAWAIQRGILAGWTAGCWYRCTHFFEQRMPLRDVIKYPDISYYKALFTSLKGYSKIW